MLIRGMTRSGVVFTGGEVWGDGVEPMDHYGPALGTRRISSTLTCWIESLWA